jgi:hypothetical protein
MKKQNGLGLGMRVAVLATFAIIAGLLAASQVSAQGSQVSIPRRTINVGSTTTLDLTAEDIGGLGLAAWIVDVSYDAGVLDAIACDAHDAGLCNPDFSSNTVRVNGATSDGIEGDVVLARITFRCTDEGTSVLAVFVKEFADATVGDPQPMSTKVTHGSIGCVPAGEPPDVELGDVNCDGRVNSVDAQLVLQYTADLIDSLPCPDAADMNDDGRITAVDAAIILQIEAGLL